MPGKEANPAKDAKVSKPTKSATTPTLILHQSSPWVKPVKYRVSEARNVTSPKVCETLDEEAVQAAITAGVVVIIKPAK